MESTTERSSSCFCWIVLNWLITSSRLAPEATPLDDMVERETERLRQPTQFLWCLSLWLWADEGSQEQLTIMLQQVNIHGSCERGISVGSRTVHKGPESKLELILKALNPGLSITIC